MNKPMTNTTETRERLTVVRKSMMTGQLNEMLIVADPADIKRWRNGTLIQDAMPYLTSEEREFLISGMSIEEQRLFFDAPEDKA